MNVVHVIASNVWRAEAQEEKLAKLRAELNGCGGDNETDPVPVVEGLLPIYAFGIDAHETY